MKFEDVPWRMVPFDIWDPLTFLLVLRGKVSLHSPSGIEWKIPTTVKDWLQSKWQWYSWFTEDEFKLPPAGQSFLWIQWNSLTCALGIGTKFCTKIHCPQRIKQFVFPSIFLVQGEMSWKLMDGLPWHLTAYIYALFQINLISLIIPQLFLWCH